MSRGILRRAMTIDTQTSGGASLAIDTDRRGVSMAIGARTDGGQP
jgi:hypothetical protein